MCYSLFNCKGGCKTELCGTGASSMPLSLTTVDRQVWGIAGGITTNRKKPTVFGENRLKDTLSTTIPTWTNLESYLNL
jgi:hypothetical protein